MITIDYELRIICKYTRTPQESCLSPVNLSRQLSLLPPPPPPHPDISQNRSPFRSCFNEKLTTRINIVIAYLVLSFCVDVASDSKLAPSTSGDHPVDFSVEIQAKPSLPGKSPRFQSP